MLLILDGWGHRDDPQDNALAQADIPHWRALWATQPHTLIETSGRHVGLPDGQMGNSEVGHMPTTPKCCCRATCAAKPSAKRAATPATCSTARRR